MGVIPTSNATRLAGAHEPRAFSAPHQLNVRLLGWSAPADARKTAEVESGVASAGVAARVVAETANASPGAS